MHKKSASRALFFFLQILLCGREHQLDAVQLVDLRGAGIVVDRDDVRERVLVPELLDDALSDNVVRQAGERLRADDVVDARVQELEHFAGQEPPLAGLVADGYDRVRVFREVLDMCGRVEVPALLKFVDRCGAEPFERFDPKLIVKFSLL